MLMWAIQIGDYQIYADSILHASKAYLLLKKKEEEQENEEFEGFITVEGRRLWYEKSLNSSTRNEA